MEGDVIQEYAKIANDQKRELVTTIIRENIDIFELASYQKTDWNTNSKRENSRALVSVFCSTRDKNTAQVVLALSASIWTWYHTDENGNIVLIIAIHRLHPTAIVFHNGHEERDGFKEDRNIVVIKLG